MTTKKTTESITGTMIGKDLLMGISGYDDVFYEWDALGRRVARDDGTTVSTDVQNGLQTVADYTSGTATTNPTYNYVYASYIDEPVVRDGIGGLRYYHRTQQYSINALTDSSGTIKERYAYDAYGGLSVFDGSGTARTTTAEGNRHTYTGREYDDILDLYHYRARMYDSLSGRFLGRDPIGYAYGGYSLFEFLSGNPAQRGDPYGLDWIEWHHLFPKARRSYWKNTFGIDCDDPKYGCLVKTKDHQALHPGWQNFLNDKIDTFRQQNGREPSKATIEKWIQDLRNKYEKQLKNAKQCPPCKYQEWQDTKKWPTTKKRRWYNTASALPGLRRRVGRLKRRINSRSRSGQIDRKLATLTAVVSAGALYGACMEDSCNTEIDALHIASRALEDAEVNGRPNGFFKCQDYFDKWGDVLTCMGGERGTADALSQYMCGTLYGGGL
ncbi:MAG: RHS repeat-associated core domain-containing protein [Phycisphaera sp. RhM]|nr:RHS repeat-associated core domain-containing protein [Phycisphaera sp. RhM]